MQHCPLWTIYIKFCIPNFQRHSRLLILINHIWSDVWHDINEIQSTLTLQCEDEMQMRGWVSSYKILQHSLFTSSSLSFFLEMRLSATLSRGARTSSAATSTEWMELNGRRTDGETERIQREREREREKEAHRERNSLFANMQITVAGGQMNLTQRQPLDIFCFESFDIQQYCTEITLSVDAGLVNFVITVVYHICLQDWHNMKHWLILISVYVQWELTQQSEKMHFQNSFGTP